MPKGALVRKPANVTVEQAAAVPTAAFAALQATRDKGQIEPGQQVLIIGASGGVGTFAVQIAKAFAAEVTGVCSTSNVNLVRSTGADHVIDYTRDDFARYDGRYDLIVLRDLLEAGKVLPVIDRQYQLGDAAEAFGYLATQRARGKIVLTV